MLRRIRFLLPAFTIAISLFTLQAAYASTIQIPQTGQTLCYDLVTNASTPCTMTTGQDGNMLSGKPSPSSRFTNNNNGTVTDNLTGLIWLRDAGCFATVGGITKGTSAVTSGLTWANALTWSNALKNGDCTLSDSSVAGDWRLPNRKELESLVDAQNSNPALPSGHQFGNVQAGYYWSSSSYANATNSAWVVDMGAGAVRSVDKFIGYYVWPVRAGQ
jgi:hypothetical protein